MDIVELRILFKGNVEKKYRLIPDNVVNDSTLRNTLGGILALYANGDFPILTDEKGLVFCLPNASEIVTMEARLVKDGKR